MHRVWKQIQSRIPALLSWLLIGVGIWLRWGYLRQNTGFTFDQEHVVSFPALRILSGDLTLIGAQTGVGGLYISPLYSYLAAFWYWLFALDPIAGAVMTASIMTITFVVGYCGVRFMHGNASARTFLLLWMSSSYLLDIERTSWNVTLFPLGTLVTFFGIWMLSHTRRIFGWVLMGIGFFIAGNSHFSAIFLPLIVGISVWKMHQWSVRGILVYGIFILATIAPLIVFDIRHDHLLLSNANILFSDSISSSAGWDWRLVFTVQTVVETIGSIFLFSHESTGSFFVGVLIVTFVLYSAWEEHKKKETRIGVITTIFLFVYSIGFTLYGRSIPPYYLIGLFPIILILVSTGIQKTLSNRGVLFCFGVYSMFQLYHGWHTVFRIDPNGLQSRQDVVQYIAKTANGQPVNLLKDMESGWSWGFSYLFRYYHLREAQPQDGGITFWVSFPASSYPLKPDFISGNLAVGNPQSVDILYQTKTIPIADTGYTTRIPKTWHVLTCPSEHSDLIIFSEKNQRCLDTYKRSILVGQTTTCSDPFTPVDTLDGEYQEYHISTSFYCIRIIDMKSGWGDQFTKHLRPPK